MPPLLRTLLSTSLLVTLACKKEKPEASPAVEAEEPEETRYVYAKEAFRYRACGQLSRPIERLPIGTEVTLVGDVSLHFGRTMRALKDGGCIETRLLAEKRPNLASALAVAHDALVAGRIELALLHARRAETLAPETRTPLLLQQAIFDLRGDVEPAKRVYERLAKLPAPGSPQPSSRRAKRTKHAKTGTAFVAATHLNLRDAPSRDGRALRRLEINDRVEVARLEGDWANVWFTPTADRMLVPVSDAITLGPDQTVPSVETSKNRPLKTVTASVSGWVSRTFLRSTPLTAQEELRAASLAEKEDRALDALTHLRRAAMIDFDAAGDPGALIRTAIGAQQYAVAVWAAAQVNAYDVGAPIDVEVLYGCRKDVPPWSGPWDEEEAVTEASVCVRMVDYAEVCDPAETDWIDDEEPPASEDAEEAATQEALRQKRAAVQQAEYELEVARTEARLERLARRFGPGRIVVKVNGPSTRTPKATRLWVYAFDYPMDAPCDEEPATGNITLYQTPIDWPKPGKTVEAYYEIDVFEGQVFGVVAAPSASAAYRAVRGANLSPDGYAYDPVGVYTQTEHAECPVPCGC